MDFGLLALVIVGAGKLLDYVAPRTKTKVDDKIREGFGYVVGLLPFVKPDLAAKVNEAKAEPAKEMARKVEGFGTARDHRGN